MDESVRFAASEMDEGRYRLLIDAIAEYAIYMLDPQGRVTSWNPGAQRIKGYTASEIMGEHFSRFYTEEEQAKGTPARALRTAREEGRFEQEGWRVRKDGAQFWAHVIIDPIREPDGELVGYAKITRDLTERKQAEDALRKSEQEFRLLVQGVTDYAIYTLDPQGRVSNWNAGAQRIKGYRPDEIVGEHFSRFYTDEDRAEGLPQRGLETARAEGRFEKEGWRLRKDGSRFWAHVVIDAIHGDDGEVIGFAKITRDITERREAQRELEMAREALFQSQKMDAIGQLTGGVAHDFNNLLTAVLGSLELLRRRMPPDPGLTVLIDNAVQGAERGAALTQRMLAFARKQELKLEPVDAPGLVRSMTGLLQTSLGPGISIRTEFPLAMPRVMADANQLEVALLNLAVNARDAMGEAGVMTISADTATLAPGAASGLAPGTYVCLAVSDTGEGMDEQTLARAAEPFFTTKGVGKGTGLGLAMVHGVAAQFGGQLVLRSKKGEGATAELWLPVAPEGQARVQLAEPAEEPQGRRLVVLAVDDDGLVLTNTAYMLEDLGHEVIQAASGEAALAILQTGTPVDLVITDQAMPRMTGVELAEAARRERPGLTIILATGYAELPPGVGADLPRMAKPFMQRDLARAIARTVAPASVTADA